MTYKEMLKMQDKIGISASQVYIAQEMDCQLHEIQQIKYTDERFEELCDCAYDAYLKTDYSNINAICSAVAALEKEYIEEDGKDPYEMTSWDILSEAVLYE